MKLIKQLPQKSKVHPQNNDSLFKKIFNDPKELLELCRGLTGRKDITIDDIEVTTLQENQALYVQIRNDLSFIVGTELFLIEQQTNPNPNMPVRMGSYYFNTLSQQNGNPAFHSQTLQKIPAPVLITFVNGNPKGKATDILKLSDMYTPCSQKDLRQQQIKVDGRYYYYTQVYVKVIYLNHPDNEGLLKLIPGLQGFATFTKAVRDYGKEGYSKEDAVELAIEYTLEQNLLVDLLLKEREGVKTMVMDQITQEEWDTFNFQEGRAEGVEIARVEGIEIGRVMGEINLLYNRFKRTPEAIAKELNMPVDQVLEIIDNL